MGKVKLLQSDSQAPMKPSAQTQKLVDTNRQMRRYRAWKGEQFELIARGGSGEQWRELRMVLRLMSYEEIELRLVEHIRHQTWLLEADEETRAAALSLIHGAIIKLRIRNGYAPLNDSLPGEPPTAFERIRELLQVT
ncbi:hypothetical protein CQ14_06645 [Bradyrhizobium lablabi]|uniref:Uncharacterized protein n=1 Tax=Bradyrhizobium lablabi TaxID=722472 RepID=A0A0R3MN73_9BRAD|nr:hypothetical protein [Bradyrhizobium lablabi]KRR21322.1 hypothetical protein CQ14_06645 [Bradyrhizobium lablabi]